jgi:hypothetical protein
MRVSTTVACNRGVFNSGTLGASRWRRRRFPLDQARCSPPPPPLPQASKYACRARCQGPPCARGAQYMTRTRAECTQDDAHQPIQAEPTACRKREGRFALPATAAGWAGCVLAGADEPAAASPAESPAPTAASPAPCAAKRGTYNASQCKSAPKTHFWNLYRPRSQARRATPQRAQARAPGVEAPCVPRQQSSQARRFRSRTAQTPRRCPPWCKLRSMSATRNALPTKFVCVLFVRPFRFSERRLRHWIPASPRRENVLR